ncbi:2-hydroxyisoflavanone dehydratase-like protein [Tanacetum coccineum]
MDSNKKLVYEIPNVIRVYDDGSVERLAVAPYVAPTVHDPITGISTKDVIISPEVSARLYLPKLEPTSQNKLIPILVYFHGGGFIIGSAFTAWEHNFLNTMVPYINALIISFEYRLAPEHLIPAAYQDCWAALEWVASHSKTNGENQEPWLVEFGDFDRLYIGGDSAGANIVHNLALKAGKERLTNDVKILGWGPHAEGGIDNHMINPFVGGSFNAGFCYKKMLVVVTEKDELRNIGIEYYDAVNNSEWDGEVSLDDESISQGFMTRAAQGPDNQNEVPLMAKATSSDPFNIYGMLNKRTKKGKASKSKVRSSVPYPPGFTLCSVNVKANNKETDPVEYNHLSG